MRVVISTSKVNSYGSRVLTEGIDIEQYKKNPIVLWMHARPYGNNQEESLPIGKVTDLSIGGDKLIGEIEFDEKDEFAMKIKSKYEQGILNMVSAGLDVVELSDDESLVLPGQRRMTISKSRLREVSCVDIGANDDSLKLYYKDADVKMEEELDRIVPLLKEFKENLNNNKTVVEMKEVLKTLNLKEDSSEKMAIDAIEELKKKAGEADSLQQQLAAMNKERIELMVEQAVKEGKLAGDKRQVFVQIGMQNGEEMLKNALEGLQGVPDVGQALHREKGEKIELSAQTWDKMDKEGSLAELKKNDKETYDKLFEAKFKK